jgi:hypothetical protein
MGNAMTLISQKLTRFFPGRAGAPEALRASSNVQELNPYSTQDLKYLWALWDEAQRYQQPYRRDRNICVGAGMVVIVGWLISWLDLSGSFPLGGVLMTVGALTGAWYCLKYIRNHGRSAPGK